MFFALHELFTAKIILLLLHSHHVGKLVVQQAHGVWRKCGWTEVQSAAVKSQSSVRAGQTTLNFSSYFHHYNFNQQRFQADGIMPHLPQSPAR